LHEKNQDLHLELSPVSLGALLSAVKGSESAGAWRRAWWMMQCHAGTVPGKTWRWLWYLEMMVKPWKDILKHMELMIPFDG